MQKKNIFKILLAGLLVLVSFQMNAQENEHNSKEEHGKVNTREGIKEFIGHHLKDSHYLDFAANGETGEHYGIALPVILWDNGLKVFSAERFHHGEDLVTIDGQTYRLFETKIYKTDAEGTIHYNKEESEYPVNNRPLDLSITKNVVGMILIGALMFLMFASLGKSYKKGPQPGGMGRFLEPLVIYVRDDIAKPNIGPHYRKYMGFLLTVFFFIWLLNLLGMTPMGMNITGNIAITFGLAVITFIIVQFSGNRHYWKHIFWMPGVPVPMKIVLIPIELLGIFTKPFALMIRLFANMTAGHVVIMSLLGLIVVFQSWFAGPAFFGFSLFIMVIELLVAFLQAYIFTLLSALYIGMAVEDHHEHPDDHGDEAPVL